MCVCVCVVYAVVYGVSRVADRLYYGEGCMVWYTHTVSCDVM